jgi:hypothetical protein
VGALRLGPRLFTLIGFYYSFDCPQGCLCIAGNSAFRDEVQELGLKRFRRIEVADLHLRQARTQLLKRRFHPVVAEDSADTKRVLGQNGDDSFHRNYFDVSLDTCVLPARKVALIPNARFAEPLAINQIDPDHAGMEFGDSRQIHSEGPNNLQWRVDDNFLLRSEWWSHCYLGFAVRCQVTQLRLTGGRDGRWTVRAKI